MGAQLVAPDQSVSDSQHWQCPGTCCGHLPLGVPGQLSNEVLPWGQGTIAAIALGILAKLANQLRELWKERFPQESRTL